MGRRRHPRTSHARARPARRRVTPLAARTSARARDSALRAAARSEERRSVPRARRANRRARLEEEEEEGARLSSSSN
eukprot:29739-Pelagococcus_subviridis.AAC.7